MSCCNLLSLQLATIVCKEVHIFYRIQYSKDFCSVTSRTPSFIISAILLFCQAMQPHTLKALPEIFLFVNPHSGGSFGQQLLQTCGKRISFNVPRSQRFDDKSRLATINLSFFNIYEEEQRSAGFQELAKLTEADISVIVVICGGDGSIMSAVTEMSNFHIDYSKVPIAIIPLGSGNSLSRVLGWGEKNPDLLSNNYAKLKKRVTYWLSAEPQNLDIWMIEAEVQQYGKFEKVFNCQTKLLDGKKLCKHFCNYFSMGIDAKIGYSFDLHRTSTRLGNFAVYGTMAFIKSFTQTKSLGELVSSFRLTQDQTLDVQSKDERHQSEKKSEKGVSQQGAQTMQIFKENQNILFININSFMGGVQDIWNNAKLPQNLQTRDFNPPSHNDGKIEVVSFGGAWSLVYQKVIGGAATKLNQGRGPFSFDFNRYPQQQKHRTYLQIDGQHYRFTHPKSLTVKKSTLSKTSQIRVLRRVKPEALKGCCM